MLKSKGSGKITRRHHWQELLRYLWHLICCTAASNHLWNHQVGISVRVRLYSRKFAISKRGEFCRKPLMKYTFGSNLLHKCLSVCISYMVIVFTCCNSENSTCLIIRINLAIISHASGPFHLVTPRNETDICQEANESVLWQSCGCDNR